MLAPEEVFSGQGDIKDETELTKAERKRRRANKKRKFKGDILGLYARYNKTGCMIYSAHFQSSDRYNIHTWIFSFVVRNGAS